MNEENKKRKRTRNVRHKETNKQTNKQKRKTNERRK